MSSYQMERDQLNDILDQREYQIYYEDRRGIFQRIWDFFAEWIKKLLDLIFESFDPNTTLGNTLVTTIMVVLLIIVVVGILATTIIIIRKKRLATHRPFDQPVNQNWGWNDHLQAAQQYADESNYRLATRHQFLAFLLFLNHTDWIETKRWKTNWEYYDELRERKKELAIDFYQFALFFERITYGEQEVTINDYEPYQKEIKQWINQIQSQTENKEIGES